MKLKTNDLLLFSILLLGFFLRVYNISGESVWLDEGYSIRIAKLEISQIVEESANDVHPPFYYIILHFWIKLFDDSEFTTRLLSAFFDCFAIFVIYKVGVLLFNREVGLLSALLLTLSRFHIQYSQEVRMYTLMSFLALLSFYFYVKILEKREIFSIFGYVTTSVFLLYTHIHGLFIVAAQNIHFLFFLFSQDRKQNWLAKWVAVQSVVLLAFSPWIIVVIKKLAMIRSKVAWLAAPSFKSFIQTFSDNFGSNDTFGLMLVLLSFAILSSSAKNLKKTGNLNQKHLLLLWTFIPTILPFALSHYLFPIYGVRYTIAASLAYYIMIAKGISHTGKKAFKIIIIAVLTILSLSSILDYYNTPQKEQWRKAVMDLELDAHAGDLVLFNAGFMQENAFDYYSKRTDLVKKSVQELKEFGPAIEDHSRVWLILSHARSSSFFSHITKTYQIINHDKYMGIETYLFERNETVLKT